MRGKVDLEVDLVKDVVENMERDGEPVPIPFSDRRYSGSVRLRTFSATSSHVTPALSAASLTSLMLLCEMCLVERISLPDMPLASSSRTSLALILFAICITSFRCPNGDGTSLGGGHIDDIGSWEQAVTRTISGGHIFGDDGHPRRE